MAISLDENTFALTWSEEDGFNFFMPSNLDDDADLSEGAMFLAAITIKLSDEAFVRGVIEELKQKE